MRFLVLIALGAFLQGPRGWAEEKNGLMATVTKKTAEHSTVRSLAHVQKMSLSLLVDLTNASIRDFPEGDVQWTIVVRRSYEGGLEKYSGKEALKVLHAAQRLQVAVADVPITNRKNDNMVYKDKVEYEVVIHHQGKETMRLCSEPNFAALVSRATSMDRVAEVDPAKDPSKAAVAPPKTPDPAPPPPDVNKPFDFFNLGKKAKEIPAPAIPAPTNAAPPIPAAPAKAE